MKSLALLGLTCLGAVAWSAPAAAAKIACVGDSITYGYGLSDPTTQSYPAVLQGLLGKSHTVKNFGASGTTLLKNGDKPYWDDANFAASGDFAPDVVIVMLGTNDAKAQNWAHESEFVTDYEALVAHYRGLGAFVYVAAPPPVYDPGAYDIQPSVLNEDIVPRERQLATDLSAPLIDVYAALSNKASDFPDTVHPNADGAKLIAQTVNAALALDGFGGNGGAGASGVGGAQQGGRSAAEGGGGNTAGTNAGGTSGNGSAGHVAAGSGGRNSDDGGRAGSATMTAGTTGIAGGTGARSGSGGMGAGSGGSAPIAGSGTTSAAGTQGAAGASGNVSGSGGGLPAAGTSDRETSAAHSNTNDGGCGCRVRHSAGMRDRGALLACVMLLAIARRKRLFRR